MITPRTMDKKIGSCLWAWLIAMMLFTPSPMRAEDDVKVKTGVEDASEAKVEVKAISVVIDAASHLHEKYADMARRIIPIQAGMPLTPKTMDEAIKTLTQSRRFSKIHVDSVSHADGEALIFTLTPFHYAKEIRIHNYYPLFERDILNQMTIYPGDPLETKNFSDQADAIVELYKREGYVDPKVTIQSQEEPDGETAVVVVDIEKGHHYRLGTLTFTKNRGIGPGRLKPRMHIWRASLMPFFGRFSEYRLAQDMKNLTQYYWRKGYFDARLSYRLSPPDEHHRVDVNIEVEEKSRHRIAFSGNTHFWNLTLKKDVVLFTEGNRNGTGTRKSIRNMRRRYENAGYQDVRVRVEAAHSPDASTDLDLLRFVINEGPRTIVDAVTIAGNQSIEEKRIEKELLTRPPSLFHSGAFVPETLDEDLYAVTTLYMKEGFRERSVEADVATSEDRTRASVSIVIDEGPRTRVRSIEIESLSAVPEAAARETLIHQVGEPFRESALNAEKEAIISLVSEAGYPHARVDSRVTFSEDQTQADIVHRVDPGPQVKLGQIFIAGNLRTEEKVIRRELDVTPGMPLSLRTLHDGQRQLRDLYIFHGVQYRTFGLKEKDETVNLFVDVEEEKPYYFQIGGGYESDSGFFGRARVGDRNIFGLNKELWAAGEISETGYRVETRLNEPRFLGYRIGASVGFFNEETIEFNQPFGTRTTGGALSFSRDWGAHVTTALSFSLEKRDQFTVEDRPADLMEEDSRTIFVTTPYVRYDSRDSFVRPTKGLFSSLSVDISKGIDNEIDDFVRYLLDMRIYRSPLSRLTFAGLGRIGQVHPYSNDERVPDDQLFFLGGIQDVRGYKENLLRFDENGDPVGGKTAVVGSLEARVDLGRNWELTTFFDIGSVQNTQVPGGSDRFRSSVGLGLRYITPVGPMGLLYGYKLDREEGASAGRLHLSIGYSF